MKLSIAAFCILVVALVSLRFHLNASAPQSSTILQIHEAEGIPVAVATPMFRDIFKEIHPTGNIKETTHITAGFEISGRLKTLNVSVGQYIHRGEIIAQLDTRSQEIKVAADRAALSMAEARLKKAVKGPRLEEHISAKALLDGANSTVKYAEEELVRVRDLVAKDAATQRQLDQADNNFKNALSAQEVAKTKIALLRAGTREEDIMEARANVLLARAHLNLSIIGLEDHTLISPISGLVSAVPVEEGDVISPVPTPKTIAEILEVSPILFECTVSELFIPYLSSKTRATVTIDAFPGIEHDGSFYELVPKGNLSDRTFTVRFAIKNGDRKLKPGMFGRSTIKLSQPESTMTVPLSVLRDPISIEDSAGGEVVFTNLGLFSRPTDTGITSDGETDESKPVLKAVMVSINGFAAARLVQPGFVQGNYVEIKAGLSKSDLVVTEGFAELKTGAKLFLSENNLTRTMNFSAQQNTGNQMTSDQRGVN